MDCCNESDSVESTEHEWMKLLKIIIHARVHQHYHYFLKVSKSFFLKKKKYVSNDYHRNIQLPIIPLINFSVAYSK